jgi:Holliday junction resolvasome RuvABC endonuclease subunit
LLLLEHWASSPEDGSAEQRLTAIAHRLWELAERFPPAAVGYEDQTGVTVGKGNSTAHSRRLFEVCGMIRLVAMAQQAALYVMQPNTAKAVAAGDGRASKAQVKHAVRVLFGHDARLSSHAADAAAIWLATRAHFRRARI